MISFSWLRLLGGQARGGKRHCRRACERAFFVSPARQLAQVAIAARCGNNAKNGISFLEALSLPVIPAKVFGDKALFGSWAVNGNLGDAVLRGYKGFKTPLSLLEDLSENHSFVDLMEKLLLGAAKRNGEKSILEAERIEPGTAVIFGHTAQITFNSGQFFRETAKYLLPEKIAWKHKDVAHFSSSTTPGGRRI